MNRKHLKCFISYSHKDKSMCDKFREQLACLERLFDIEHWYDGMIPAGGVIDNEINKQLECSDIVFLLISPSYIQSYYCYEKELTNAIERHCKGTCKVIPVIIKKYPQGEYLFSKLKFVPTNGRAVSSFKSHNDGFVDAMAGIKSLLQEFCSSQNPVKLNSTKERIKTATTRKVSIKPTEDNPTIKYEIIKNGKKKQDMLSKEIFDSIMTYNQNQIRFVAEMNNLTRENIERFKDEATKSAPHKNMRYRRNMEDFMLQTGGYIQQLFVGYTNTCIHFRTNQGLYYNDYFEMGYSKNELSTGPIVAHNGMIECSKKNGMPVIKKFNRSLHKVSHPNESVARNYITFAFNNISDKYNIDLSMCISIVGSNGQDGNIVLVAMSIMRFDLLVERYLIQYVEQCRKIDTRYDVRATLGAEV